MRPPPPGSRLPIRRILLFPLALLALALAQGCAGRLPARDEFVSQGAVAFKIVLPPKAPPVAELGFAAIALGTQYKDLIATLAAHSRREYYEAASTRAKKPGKRLGVEFDVEPAKGRMRQGFYLLKDDVIVARIICRPKGAQMVSLMLHLSALANLNALGWKRATVELSSPTFCGGSVHSLPRGKFHKRSVEESAFHAVALGTSSEEIRTAVRYSAWTEYHDESPSRKNTRQGDLNAIEIDLTGKDGRPLRGFYLLQEKVIVARAVATTEGGLVLWSMLGRLGQSKAGLLWY